jgi:glycosyltransferase involved in cell wall biosynthesis
MDAIRCVIPTLNSARTLDMTLLSLRSQAGVEVEVVVVDSGSSDGTLEICRRWNITPLYAAPGNMYHAINLGLAENRAEWFTYLNSDDWLYPDSFVRLITLAKSSQAEIAYGNCDYVDAAGRFVYSFAAAKPEQLLSLFRTRRMGFAQPAAICRREVYEQQDGFAEKYLYNADAEFYIRAVSNGARFTYLPGPSVACFRIHAQQLSASRAEQIEAEGEEIFGAEALRPHFSDWLTLSRWRCRNLPHYLIRILRESLLSKRVRLPRTIESYAHQ